MSQIPVIDVYGRNGRSRKWRVLVVSFEDDKEVFTTGDTLEETVRRSGKVLVLSKFSKKRRSGSTI